MTCRRCGAALALMMVCVLAAPARPAEGPPSRTELFGMRAYPPPAEGKKIPKERDATFFPLIDTFGQYIHRDWPGKTHGSADLVSQRHEEGHDLKAHPGPKGWTRFGGWADGPTLEATGFFRTEKRGGRWWLVDPTGRLFFSHGVDCVGIGTETPLEDRRHWFRDFPGDQAPFGSFLVKRGNIIRDYYQGREALCFNFHQANLLRKYGPEWKKVSATLAHVRLRSWGYNTIGNWSDAAIYGMRQTPYVATVHFGSRVIEGSEGFWGKFKDPFDPSFAAALNERLAPGKHRWAGNPWCIGVFVDNELGWGDEVSLARATLQSPADQPAKRVFVDDLRRAYGAIEKLNAAWRTRHASWDALLASREVTKGKGAEADLKAFYTKLAEAYFRTVRQAVKGVAPKQLYLGCRFAWVNDRVLVAAAKYADVVSFNLYRRSVANFRPGAGVDLPVIVGEFHFGALDRGLFHPGLVKVKDQEARAAAYVAYVRGAIANPCIVGCHWFQYRDQPTTGRRLDGENYQIGLVDVCDRPYPETVAAAREVGYTLYGH